MIRVVYSFNKKGAEASFWAREISGASTDRVQFLPFNHDRYLDPNRYIRAQLLDNLFYEKHPALLRLYAEFEEFLGANAADALVVDNCPPYHPDYLRRLPIYKLLRVADGPTAAYDRDFAYLHAYDHVLYHTHAYSAEMGMAEKLRYCGAKKIDYWPLGLFDAAFDLNKAEEVLLSQERDIEVIFIGAQHISKMPQIAKVKKTLGRKCRIYGLTTLKRNVYFNLRYGFPGWVRQVRIEDYVPLYQRAKIGFNLHLRGKYTIGNYRMFELPANGVMQISDGDEYLPDLFKPGEEIVRYSDTDELIRKIVYFLKNDDERRAIARNAYRRVIRDHRFRDRMRDLSKLIEKSLSSRVDRSDTILS